MRHIYKNIKFVKRDYNCTNIICCEPLNNEAVIPENYSLCAESELDKLTPLYVENNVRYYGYL